MELTSEAAEAAVDIQHGSMWFMESIGHNLEAQAVTRSYKYTQVWHVHVGIQEYVKSCWRSLRMPLFDGQGPGENFGQHFWQVNVRAFALSDPTVLYLLVTASRHVRQEAEPPQRRLEHALPYVCIHFLEPDMNKM